MEVGQLYKISSFIIPNTYKMETQFMMILIILIIFFVNNIDFILYMLIIFLYFLSSFTKFEFD
jgi:hypothetical protein